MNASSPSTYPPPPPPSGFGSRRPRGLMAAITGPVMMIVVGVLFIIAYNGGPNFGRTWPVIVIVLGLLRLVDYMSSRPQGPGSYANTPGAPGI